MRRISVAISENEDKVLKWIQDETACTITDAVRIALSLVGENFNAAMLLKHRIELKKKDRQRPGESR